jgi:hypothetical protein
MNEEEAARLFASMGGKARAKKLSKKRRVDIARSGGLARSKKALSNTRPNNPPASR